MRHRNMYHMTGLPGWMRFGYSPGWAGRSASGLGPGAEYLMMGQWPNPQMAAAWQAMQMGMPPMMGMGMPPMMGMGFGPETYGYGIMNPMGMWGQPDPRAQQVDMLRQQAEMLQGELEQINQQIADLEGQ